MLNWPGTGRWIDEADGSYDMSVLTEDVMPVTRDEAGDRELLAAARAGDAEAFGELCRSYEARLLRQAVALCGNVAVGEELAQETLVEAWNCLRRYDGRCKFFTWVCAILLNRFRNYLRQKRARWGWDAAGMERPDERDLLRHSGFDEAAAGPDQAVLLSERAAIVSRCVQSLPPKHQQVIHLRFFAGDSLEGIAAVLGCSVGTVKSRLFHALEKLRKMKDLELKP